MTCIIGVKTSSGVLLAADSLASSWSTSHTRQDPKLHKYRRNLAIGLCGSPRAMQILRFHVDPPKIDRDEFEWAVTQFVPVIRTAFTELGYAEVRHNVEGFDSDFIVAVNNRILTVECDYQVAEEPQIFNAVGSGAREAKGAMYSLSMMNKTPTPRYIATRGLEAAEEFARGVRRPWNFIEVRS